MITKRILILIISLVSGGTIFSQSTIRLAFNKKISTDDGLSSYNVKKNFEDKYGFIWIVTQEGLNRYDGREFLVYNKSMDSDHQLLGSDVWDVEQDSKRDILWVVTSYGGLNGIHLKTKKVCWSLPSKISKQGFNHDWLRCLKLVGDDLWIGTYDGLTLYNVETKSFTPFEPLPFKKSAASSFCVDKIFVDTYENIWVFIANYGVVIYSGKNRSVIDHVPMQHLQLQNQLTYKQFNSVTALSAGILLTGTSQGFRKISYTRKGITGVSTGLFNNDESFNDHNIDASALDTFRYLWFSSSSKLFKAQVDSGVIYEVKDARINLQNDWFNNIYDIFFDTHNNTWLGTGKGVTYTKNALPAFTPYYVSEDQQTKIDHALYVYPVNDTVVYACMETGLLRINLTENKIQSLDDGKRYYFILKHIDGNLLVSSEDSFFIYRPADNRFFEISRFYPELSPIGHISVNSIIYTSDSLAVIGTQTGNGFYLWNYKKGSLEKYQSAKMAETSESAIVNACYMDMKKRIWILGNKLITLFDQNSKAVRNVSLINSAHNVPYNLFFDICEAGGYFWIAAYGSGLIQVDKNFTIKKVFSIKEGLSNAGVYKLFPVNDSLIFISTNYGLSVLNINTNLFSNYFTEDGLNSNAFEQGCGVSQNGKIYLGGVNGFTVIDPKHFEPNTISPRLYLNHIRMETESGFSDTSNTLLHTLRIPNNVLQTTISFSALNYSNPARTSYAYKVAELNSNWIYLGTQRSVSLMGLRPGKYTLLIKSANENNVWNETPLRLTLIYLPKWYQTILFKIFLGIAVAAILYSIYAYRISQLKKQQKIRRDISADLHDDFGGILEGVRISAHLAKKETHKQEHLNQIEDSLKQATVAFRDVIWILNDKEDTIQQFMERVRNFALPMANANGIRLDCSVQPEIHDRIFSKAEKRHLLLIVKESITNSIKYASCQNIKVTIRLLNNKIALVIEDDGKGFDVHQTPSGNGLKNLVYRAGEIHYKAEVVSAFGRGTRIMLKKL